MTTHNTDTGVTAAGTPEFTVAMGPAVEPGRRGKRSSRAKRRAGAGDLIPYHGSRDTANSRRCGLAALTMVLESLGKPTTRRALWQAIARNDLRGRPAARTFLLAQSALHHGLAAVVVQARDPWRTLRRCAAAQVRVIVNHRVHAKSPWGHYSVLVHVDEAYAVLHDPEVAPNRRVERGEMLRLWAPVGPVCEIAGHTLVAVEPRRRGPSPACEACGTLIPGAIPCPACRRPVPLRPADALGCIEETCGERLWESVYCPYCDARIEQVTAAAGAGVLQPLLGRRA